MSDEQNSSPDMSQGQAMDSEEWRPVAGFDGYEVSSLGGVRSWRGRSGPLSSPRVLRPWRCNTGYMMVDLSERPGVMARKLAVHRLVLDGFVGACPDGMECRHLNGDRADNRAENLLWGTRKENGEDRVTHGTSDRGEDNGNSRLDESDVCDIRFLLTWGVAKRQIARLFGVGQKTVYDIDIGKTWRHV